MTNKEREYMKRLWHRKGVLDIRLATTKLRDKQEIEKERNALEWALVELSVALRRADSQANAEQSHR